MTSIMIYGKPFDMKEQSFANSLKELKKRLKNLHRGFRNFKFELAFIEYFFAVYVKTKSQKN